jgi:hypothetical protein
MGIENDPNNSSDDNIRSSNSQKKEECTGPTKNSEGETIDCSGNKVRPTDWKDTNSWVSFIKSIFVYFILTLLFGLFGSSFIYLTTRGSDLDNILPTDDKFYSAKSYQVQKSKPSDLVECNETSNGTYPVFEDNFPYNLITVKGSPTKDQLKQMTFVERLTNWFAKTVAGCFKYNRGLLKWWLDSFNPDGPLGNHVFQIYFAAPFTLIVIGFLSLFTGWWSSFGAGFAADSKVTIWGGFLLYSWGLFGSLAGLICLRLIATICFYPMSQNWKEVANILACNVKPLVVLFGFFVCGAAYDTLEPTLAGVMGVVYLMLVAWTVWKYLSNQLF